MASSGEKELISGYLSKKGQFTWTQRYVVLKGNTLQYFRSDNRADLKDTYTLNTHTCVQSAKKAHSFAVVCELDTVYFCAKNEEDKRRWMRTITDHVATMEGAAKGLRSSANLTKDMKDTKSSPGSRLAGSKGGKGQKRGSAIVGEGGDGSGDAVEGGATSSEELNTHKRPYFAIATLKQMKEEHPDALKLMESSGITDEEGEEYLEVLIIVLGFRCKKIFYLAGTEPPPPSKDRYKALGTPEELEESVSDMICRGSETIFKKPNEVGAGGFGRVYNSRVSGDKEKPKLPNTVAIKKLPHKHRRQIQRNCWEITMLARCVHVNIVELYRTYIVDKEMWMIMEYMHGGTLTEARDKFQFEEEHIAYVAYELLQGLAFMHKINLVHRDVKSANVMMTVRGEIKLIDFGLCVDITEGEQTSMCGSPFWMPPEMIRRQTHNAKADIWSLAICLLELANGRPPNSKSGVKFPNHIHTHTHHSTQAHRMQHHHIHTHPHATQTHPIQPTPPHSHSHAI
eukprot:TRINITY_DN366_c0_g1_i1.p1 TRINITY_DN366_c0_g1~~TRINITY_DN366_c0_g1_i1.p1  ORF type:complete len:512 (-),score=108.28 TRINITY_DN366_c0_g1_i1:178-1713(-)